MDAYLYCADLYCEDCGNEIKSRLIAEGRAPENPDDETTYDSDDFPKGPYGDGGGEADRPQTCGDCRVALRNPLTSAGIAYVKEAIEHHIHKPDERNENRLREYAEDAGIEWPVVGGFSFDRFDVCLAYYTYMANWHGGQNSIEYAMSGVFSRIGFEPGAGYSQDPWDWDSENARGIYWALVAGETKLRDRRG